MDEKDKENLAYTIDNSLTVKGYMCAVDWQYEIGAASGGNIVHPSIEDLKEKRRCWRRCGIVEVEVKFSRWVEAQNIMEQEDDEVQE